MTQPQPTTTASLEVHRLLDQVFAGVEMTPARQDLKEEIRADLVARVAELVGDGMGPREAAALAVDSLGDIRDVLLEIDADGARPAGGTTSGGVAGPGGSTRSARSARTSAPGSVADLLELQSLHRVRPKPEYVVRVVLLGALTAAGAAVVVLGTWLVDVALGGRLVAAIAVALGVGAITGDALAQETTTNHPMPRERAAGYGLGVGLAVVALALATLYWPGHDAAWPIVGAAVLVTAAALLTALGVTQTNRRKAWTQAWTKAWADATSGSSGGEGAGAWAGFGGDRFTEDPAAAARFGIYTAVLWLVAISTFIALSVTVGWAWSWTALVGAVVVMLVMLARMEFAPRGR